MRPSMRWGVVIAGGLLLAGCIRDTRDTRERGVLGQSNVPTIAAPEKPRCTRYPNSGAGKRCEEAEYLGKIFVRKLSTGDQVCIQGGFGDSDTPGAACLARAAVVDVERDGLLLEVREAKPDSKWFNKVQNQFWFEEGALVDLYLADHGY